MFCLLSLAFSVALWRGRWGWGQELFWDPQQVLWQNIMTHVCPGFILLLWTQETPCSLPTVQPLSWLPCPHHGWVWISVPGLPKVPHRSYYYLNAHVPADGFPMKPGGSWTLPMTAGNIAAWTLFCSDSPGVLSFGYKARITHKVTEVQAYWKILGCFQDVLGSTSNSAALR